MLKADLGAVIRESRANVTRPKNRGFVVNRQQCTGALKRLQRCFYRNYGSTYKDKNRTKSKRKPKGGKRVGDLFHRQVYHRFKCYDKPASCICTARFGKRTAAPRKGTIGAKRLDAFTKFLSDRNWQVFDCELVASIGEMKCATAIDVVCVDNLEKPNYVYILELKFGYEHNLHVAVTLDGTRKMLGPVGQYIPNTYANHHQLQLWFEMESFEQTYGIKPTHGAVVYINDGPRGKPCVYHAEMAATWWFSQISTRAALLKQFLLTG